MVFGFPADSASGPLRSLAPRRHGDSHIRPTNEPKGIRKRTVFASSTRSIETTSPPIASKNPLQAREPSLCAVKDARRPEPGLRTELRPPAVQSRGRDSGEERRHLIVVARPANPAHLETRERFRGSFRVQARSKTVNQQASTFRCCSREQKTNVVITSLVVALRACSVSFVGPTGVRHSVDVTAESLYEAAAMGLSRFRQDGWVDKIAPGT
jgi:hypothetical protein